MVYGGGKGDRQDMQTKASDSSQPLQMIVESLMRNTSRG